MTREEEINNYAYNHYTSEDDTSYKLIKDAIEWADDTMIEKAYKWLKQNAKKYVVTCYDEGELNDEDLLNDFCKAMEE